MKLSNPRRVAQEVIAQVRKGQKINLGDAMTKTGYSENMSKQPSRITKKKDFQEAIFDAVNVMEEIRKKDLIELLDDKIRAKMTPRDRVESVDKMTKNIQLISGKATSNDKMTVKWDD